MDDGDLYTRWFEASVVHRTICIIIVPVGPLSDFRLTPAADGKESGRKAHYRLAST